MPYLSLNSCITAVKPKAHCKPFFPGAFVKFRLVCKPETERNTIPVPSPI